MIYQVMKGARNSQQESCAILKQSEKQFHCVFRDCFVVNLDRFFACQECKPGRHFFPELLAEVNTKGYSEFD